jgi:hypothetical protein
MKADLDKLVEQYNEHHWIIIGLDFDDTIYPLSEDPTIIKRCTQVVHLIKKVRSKIKLCLWTVAEPWSIKYKITISKDVYGIEFDAINQSVLYETFDKIRKPYFNLLLDDKAGLDSAIELLHKFHLKTKYK